MRPLVGVLAAAMGASVFAQTRPATHELDTLAYPAEPSRDDSTPSSVGHLGMTTDISRPLQLRVTLESVSPTGAAYGDRLTYEILVENRDRRSVLLPWSPGARPVWSSDRRTAPSGSIALVARDGSGRRLTDFALQPLAGSPARAGSVQLLAPGETARIRAAGEWRTSERGLSAVLSQPSQTIQVSAIFSINGIVHVVSDNSVEVILRGPKSH